MGVAAQPRHCDHDYTVQTGECAPQGSSRWPWLRRDNDPGRCDGAPAGQGVGLSYWVMAGDQDSDGKGEQAGSAAHVCFWVSFLHLRCWLDAHLPALPSCHAALCSCGLPFCVLKLPPWHMPLGLCRDCSLCPECCVPTASSLRLFLRHYLRRERPF